MAKPPPARWLALAAVLATTGCQLLLPYAAEPASTVDGQAPGDAIRTDASAIDGTADVGDAFGVGDGTTASCPSQALTSWPTPALRATNATGSWSSSNGAVRADPGVLGGTAQAQITATGGDPPALSNYAVRIETIAQPSGAEPLPLGGPGIGIVATMPPDTQTIVGELWCSISFDENGASWYLALGRCTAGGICTQVEMTPLVGFDPAQKATLQLSVSNGTVVCLVVDSSGRVTRSSAWPLASVQPVWQSLAVPLIFTFKQPAEFSAVAFCP